MPVPMSVMQAAAQGDKKAMRLVEQEYGVGDGRRYAENWLSEEEPPPRVPGYIDHPESKEGDPDTENIVLDVPYFGSRNVIGLEHPVPPYTPEGEYGKLTSLNKLDPMTYFYGGQTQQPYYLSLIHI